MQSRWRRTDLMRVACFYFIFFSPPLLTIFRHTPCSWAGGVSSSPPPRSPFIRFWNNVGSFVVKRDVPKRDSCLCNVPPE